MYVCMKTEKKNFVQLRKLDYSMQNPNKYADKDEYNKENSKSKENRSRAKKTEIRDGIHICIRV